MPSQYDVGVHSDIPYLLTSFTAYLIQHKRLPFTAWSLINFY